MSNEQGSSKSTAATRSAKGKEEKKIIGMEELSSFADLMEGQSTNVGCFVIINTEYIPYLTYPRQNQPILNWLLEDRNGVLAHFSNYGETANKFQSFQVGQVINIECFKWTEETKHLDLGNVIINQYKGISFENTDVILSPALTEKMGKSKIPDYGKIFSLDEVIKHNSKIVLDYVKEFPKIHRQTERYEGFVKTLVFKSADGVNIHLTFFSDNVDREFKLRASDVCLITGATLSKMYHNIMELGGHGHTEIVVIREASRPDKQKKLHPLTVTLAALKKMDEQERSDKYFKIKCVARSQPFVNKHGFTELLVSDGSEAEGKMIAAAFRIEGTTQIGRGKTFSATVHFLNEHGTPVMVAEAETVKEDIAQLETSRIFSIATTRL